MIKSFRMFFALALILLGAVSVKAQESLSQMSVDSLIIGEETVLQVGKTYVLGKKNNLYKVKFTAEKDGFLSITPSQKVKSTGWKINGASSTFTKDANGGIDKKGMAAGSVFTGQFYCSADPSAENVYELAVTFEEGTPYSPLALTLANPANGGEWSGAAQYTTYGTKGAAHFEFSTLVSANTVASIKVGEKVYSPVKLTVSTSSKATLDVTAMADTLKKAVTDGLIKAGDTFTLTLSNIVDKEFSANTLADQTFTYTLASTACTGVSPTASTSRSNMMPDVTFSFDGNVALADTAKFYLLNLFNNARTTLTGEIVDGTKVKVTIPAIEGLLPRRYNIVAEGVTTAEGDKVITYGTEPGNLVASYGTNNGFFKATTSLSNWAKVATLEGFTATYPAAVMKVDGIATKPIKFTKVDQYLGTEEEIEGVTLKDSIDEKNPNVIHFTLNKPITESGTYRFEVPQKHYWAKDTYTEADARLSTPIYAYYQAGIILNIDVEDPTLLNNLVDSLNTLIVEVEEFQKTLDATDETQADMIARLDQYIAYAKSVAEAKESVNAVNAALNELRNVYVSITTYLAQMEAQAAQTVMAEYENPTDKAGLAAAITKVSEIVSYLSTGMGDIVYTVADLNAAVEAMKAAKEAFIKENTPAENNMAIVKSWDFAAMATVNPGNTTMTYSDETIMIGRYPSNLGTGLYGGLAMQGADKFMLRPGNGGLYSNNSGGRKVGVLDLVPGQVVTIVTSEVSSDNKSTGSCLTLADESNAVLTSSEIADGKITYVYTMTGEGILALTMTRYYTIHSITVEQQVEYAQTAIWDFRDEAQFAKDTRVAVASLVTEYAKLADGTVLYESTQKEFAGLVFQPAKDDNTQSWWVRRRNTGTDYGLAAMSQTRWFGIKDLKAGSKVTVESKSAMPLADTTMVSGIVKNDSTACGYGVSYTYTMAEDGVLAFSNNGCYMYRIIVESLGLPQISVDSLVSLVNEMLVWKEGLNANDEVHATIIATLEQMISEVRIVIDNPKSEKQVGETIANVTSVLETSKQKIARYDASIAATIAADEAQAFYDSYTTPIDTVGLVTSIQRVREGIELINDAWNPITVEELSSRVEAMKVALRLFIEDNSQIASIVETLRVKIEEVNAWWSSLEETDTIRMMVIAYAESLVQSAETLIASQPTVEQLEEKIQELVSFVESYSVMIDVYDTALEVIRIAKELMAEHPDVSSTLLERYLTRLESELNAYSENRVSRVQSYIRSLKSSIESFKNNLHRFSIPNASVRLFESFEVPVSMVNDEEISAFQCDIYLHGYLQANMDNEGEYDIKLNADRATGSHTIASELQADGAIRVIVYSNDSKPFKGNSGELFTIGLTALSEEFPADSVIGISVRNIHLSTSDEREILIANAFSSITVKTYTPADVNGDGSVSIVDVVAVVNNLLGRNTGNFIFEAADMDRNGEITIVDVVAVVNVLLGKDVQTNAQTMFTRSSVISDIHVSDAEVNAGETKTLYVRLDNAQAYTAMQMDMNMPEGLSIEGVEMIGSLSHAVSYSEEGRIATYSLDNSRFGEGESLMAITVKADDNFIGEAQVGFTNVRVVSANVQETILADVLANITGGDTNGNVGLRTDEIVQTLYYSATGVVSDKPHRGLNVIKHIYEDGRVEVNKEVCE